MNSNISELWNPRPYFLDFYRVFCYIINTSLFEGIKELSRSQTDNQKRAVKAGGTRMSLERLRSVFSGNKRPLFLAGALSLPLLGAFTQQAHAAPTEQQHCHPIVTVESGKAYSYLEAKKASEGGVIVLHYGEGVEDADNEERALARLGYPVIALAGGPEGAVRVLMNGKSLRHKYSQEELDNGRLGGTVASVYDYATNEKGLFERPACGPQVAGL